MVVHEVHFPLFSHVPKKNNKTINQMLGQPVSRRWLWSSATVLFLKLFIIKAALIKSNCPAIAQIYWRLL